MPRARPLTSLVVAFALVAPSAFAADEKPNTPVEYDIVVYGATAGGVAAAIQGSRMGKNVVLVEPGRHVGGLTSGGLGATDIGNKAAIGGISREFYRRVGKHYADDKAWKFQKRVEYKSSRQAAGEDEMWTFEPHVAEAIFRDMLREAQPPITLALGARLVLDKGVQSVGGRIVSILTENGLFIRGRMFIDATYEGDLMAKAGVAYTIGREANAKYGETLNGVQTKNAVKHQFIRPIDPYIEPGNVASGLLPGVHGGMPGEEGAGDERVQAYNFRLCLTDDPRNRLPFPRPSGYDPLRYELLLRYIQAGVWDAMNSNIPMPNRKTDLNNNGGFSTDNIGMNYDYPDADYPLREEIFADHVEYQQGMLWFLANDSRVPENVRQQVNRWGLARDEFTATGGWPHQLYVREARRMVSDVVMTQHHCQGRQTAADAVGLAAYTMDSHNVQRYVKDGQAINEGDVQVRGFPPYPISYRAIVPKERECKNLCVPVCLSASHIAYGSIRMEPVFMVLCQSAATAAVMALDGNIAVQNVDYAKLRERLVADKQVLEWPIDKK